MFNSYEQDLDKKKMGLRLTGQSVFRRKDPDKAVKYTNTGLNAKLKMVCQSLDDKVERLNKMYAGSLYFIKDRKDEVRWETDITGVSHRIVDEKEVISIAGVSEDIWLLELPYVEEMNYDISAWTLSSVKVLKIPEGVDKIDFRVLRTDTFERLFVWESTKLINKDYINQNCKILVLRRVGDKVKAITY